MNIEINQYREDLYHEIADLFYLCVHSIDKKIYSQSKLNAWAPYPVDYDKWQQRSLKQKPFLAFVDKTLVGFIELEYDGYINCFYVHPDFQRRGIGNALLQFIMEEAKNKRLERIYVDASLVAKDFFQEKGFLLIRENCVLKGNESLSNFTMKKDL